jgi:pyruvate,water dikinase
MNGPADANLFDPLQTAGPLTATFGSINGAEAFGGVATPLGWTYWATHGEIGLRNAFSDLDLEPRVKGARPTDPNTRLINPFYGRPASNLDVLRPVAERLWGSSAEAFDDSYLAGGRHSVGRRAKRTPLKRKVRFIEFAARGRFALPRWRKKLHPWWQASVMPESTSTVDQARAKYREAGDYLERVLRSHGHVSWPSQAFLERLKVKCEAAGLPGLERELSSNDEGFEEQGLIEDLWAVSREKKTLADFLVLWGFHGHAEGELSSRTWREDPSPLLPIVEAYRAKSDVENPSTLKDRQHEGRLGTEQKLLEGRPFLEKLRTRMLIQLAQTFIPLRQVGRGTFLMAFDVARCMARRIGAQMAADGLLAAPEDIFYLTESELLGALPENLETVVRFRRERREHYMGFELPERWTGDLTEAMVRAVAQNEADQAEAREGADRIEGLGVSVGVVEGRAVIVTTPDGALDLLPGDILVCVTTDPSWSAIFYAVDGVITDIGAEMSHGAIVARELGIPAVVNTRGATKQLRTGDRIRMDGTSGVVEVLERGPAWPSMSV